MNNKLKSFAGKDLVFQPLLMPLFCKGLLVNKVRSYRFAVTPTKNQLRIFFGICNRTQKNSGALYNHIRI